MGLDFLAFSGPVYFSNSRHVSHWHSKIIWNMNVFQYFSFMFYLYFTTILGPKRAVFWRNFFLKKKVRHITRIWDLGIVGAPVFEARELGEFVWLPMADIWAIYDI